MGKFNENLKFQLDGNGNAEIHYSKTTWRVTIHAKAVICNPQGTFYVRLYKGNQLVIDKFVRTGEEISADIKTDFKTDLTVKIHSDDVRSCGGSFHLQGGY